MPYIDEWIIKLWYIYKIEYYSATRNNDTWFEGKWMQLEDITLSEVNQDQKHKERMFFLIHLKTDPKISIYKKQA
jgi:hypothetical protein